MSEDIGKRLSELEYWASIKTRPQGVGMLLSLARQLHAENQRLRDGIEAVPTYEIKIDGWQGSLKVTPKLQQQYNDTWIKTRELRALLENK